MAVYKKSGFLQGKWVKAADVKSGSRCYLTAETNPIQSQFKNRDGSVKNQDVSKIHFEGDPEVYNISLNRPTLNALIDAFGEDSKNWINKVLTAETEKVLVGGKRVTALYLVPEGYEKTEDSGGYVVIVKKGTKVEVAPDSGGGTDGFDTPIEELPF